VSERVPRRWLLLFFGLTIPLALLFWLPMILQARGILRLPIPPIVLSTLGALSPVVSLVLLQRLSGGVVDLQRIYGLIRPRALVLRTAAAAALIIPTLTITGSVLDYLLGRSENLAILLPGRVDLGAWLAFAIPAHFLASLITSPLFEEPAWRGFALTQLELHGLSPVVASLAVGSYWWLWHQGMNIAFGLYPTLLGILKFVALSMITDSYYRRTNGNVFAAMLVHQGAGTANVFLQGTATGSLTGILMIGAALWLRVLPNWRRRS